MNTDWNIDGFQVAYATGIPAETGTFPMVTARPMENEFGALSCPLPQMPPRYANHVAAAEKPAPTMTERQLRALSRKHLMLMIRDLEAELRQERAEKKDLLMAYQAGLSQGRQV